MQTSGNGLGGLVGLLQTVLPTQQSKEAMTEDAFDTAMDFINGL